ncbi:hypothetical protein HMI54_007353 [Coelomomyces lativittatus]|nr:hypothetical protein HMI54_007353 [Coelomomyces lativittatus]
MSTTSSSSFSSSSPSTLHSGSASDLMTPQPTIQRVKPYLSFSYPSSSQRTPPHPEVAFVQGR